MLSIKEREVINNKDYHLEITIETNKNDTNITTLTIWWRDEQTPGYTSVPNDSFNIGYGIATDELGHVIGTDIVAVTDAIIHIINTHIKKSRGTLCSRFTERIEKYLHAMLCKTSIV